MVSQERIESAIKMVRHPTINNTVMLAVTSILRELEYVGPLECSKVESFLNLKLKEVIDGKQNVI